MSLDIGERFRRIREAEKLSREAFSDATGIPVGTLRGIESGKHEPSFAVIQKLALHEKTQQYTLWLLSGDANPGAGQAAPGASSRATRATIDRELLELLLTTVEQILTDRKMNLPADKKSKLIAYLYEQYSQEEDIEIDRPNVVQLIDFAA
jgi:transcriptional regulator with XRE-family HTH domain